MKNKTENFRSRGIGFEYNLNCFVTGRQPTAGFGLDNIAAFVDSREAGERVVEMFNGLARLDYRPKEPNWIQVKVGASEQHLPQLEELNRLTRNNGNKITKKIIEQAKKFIPANT